MKKIYKLGILRETKTPPDKRTALAPKQAAELLKRFQNIELYIQSSKIRAYKDEEYKDLGLNVVDDLSECDILAGVKEVHIPLLIPNKTYMFFSHTAKEQIHNRPLLKALLENNITLLDHEYFTDEKGTRLVAFGNWAGLVGAYNGLIALGNRTGTFQLKRAIECRDINEMKQELRKIKVPPVKFVITGGGRVANGALEILKTAGIKQILPEDFLENTYNYPVFTQLNPDSYVKRKDGDNFDLHHFFNHPDLYISTFKPYTKVADVYIACHFWDEKSPKFMTTDDMKEADFKISVIADVSCDIAGPIPSTLRASEIAHPFYGYNPYSEKEGDAFDKENITVMAVDNLPGEVPRDASVDFGNGLSEKIFPALFGNDERGIIERATITKNGKLGKYFKYLKDYAEGK
jgi:alanine dehydrogenase